MSSLTDTLFYRIMRKLHRFLVSGACQNGTALLRHKQSMANEQVTPSHCIIIRKSKWINQNLIKRKWDLQHVVRQVSESEWKGQGGRYASRDLKAGGNASSRALKGSGRHVSRALKGGGGGIHPHKH
jgi:hypothetical protein